MCISIYICKHTYVHVDTYMCLFKYCAIMKPNVLYGNKQDSSKMCCFFLLRDPSLLDSPVLLIVTIPGFWWQLVRGCVLRY